jgi:hypothetical protein
MGNKLLGGEGKKTELVGKLNLGKRTYSPDSLGFRIRTALHLPRRRKDEAD